ncbi:hypothetical protein BH10ACT9_BH10ACT9_23300 [soil metagenome]
MSLRSPAAFRALTTSAFTGALAVAAHAVAGGGWPTGGAAVLLASVAAVVGLIASADRAAGTPNLVALLAAGQLAGHLSLAIAGHLHDETSGLPTTLMLLTHAVAVLVGAALVSGCERLGSALSRVVRRCVRLACTPSDGRATAVRLDGHPWQHVLLIAASISHRGPPARVRL